ncbi:hypothetical protein COLO4_27089 [Corchorus olitorius]|uniref:FBD domain-containing protein n=1 Tax=Corchorus olitorius TaxID=93759 RepID=A0A1R3HSR6_9ROSI|nr:hypothetical protein COLO4_27089 [Corchorus olitorius]
MRKRALSPTPKRAKGKKRRISKLSRGFLPLKSESVQPTSGRQSVDNEEDRISELADDILMIILSFMKTKEAAGTCVLSRRWRYLWASLPRLDFSCDANLRERVVGYSEQQHKETLEKESLIFIHWVNSVVKMHQAQTLKECRIDFPFEKEHFNHVVDAWIEFALSKRVQRLVLDFSMAAYILSYPSIYTFPDVPSPVTSSLSDVPLVGYTFPYLLSPATSTLSDVSLVGLTSLRTLYLNCVNVKQEVVDHILSHCPMLEEFSLFGSAFVGYFKLAGPALKLKHLTLIRCRDLRCIEICDTNIVSFKYDGLKRSTELHLKNLPRLVELYVDTWESPISHTFDAISGLFSHLESLTLLFTGFVNERPYDHIPRPRDVDYFDIVAYPKLFKLRHLVVNMEMIGDFGLLKLVPLINACPYLQRFVLQLSWTEKHIRKAKKVIKRIECPHQHLKVVELAGYYGRVSDVEFAMYFIQNAVALERMIIISKCAYQDLPEIETEIVDKKEIKREEKARRRAKEQLQGNVPPTIDLREETLEKERFMFINWTDGAYGRIARPRDVNFFDIVAYPKLSKLRHLVVNMEMIGDFGLLKLVPLINACPYLQKFVLQFSWIEIEKHVRIAKNVIKTIECPHQHLKVVEFAGYYGRVSDVEFAMYFIQNAVALERMIIIPKSAFVWLPVTNTTIVQKKIVQKKKIKREAKARRRAKEQLEGNVPPTIDLVIH